GVGRRLARLGGGRRAALMRWFEADVRRLTMRVVERRLRRRHLAATAAARPRLDQLAKRGRVVVQELPAAVFGVGRGQALARRFEPLHCDVVEVVEEAAAEVVLLPAGEREQREAAQRREGEK